MMKTNEYSLKSLYDLQIKFQELVNKNIGYGEKSTRKLPDDNPQLVSYHIQQLISEIGEVLAADKRWKNYRNGFVDMENKKEEIADCFIVLMNIAIYSGMSAEELCNEILNKIEKNYKRIS